MIYDAHVAAYWSDRCARAHRERRWRERVGVDSHGAYLAEQHALGRLLALGVWRRVAEQAR